MYSLVSTQVKRIILHELTLQISLVLMRCVCTHIKVKHSLFNIEKDIRCSKLLRSRAAKEKILFLFSAEITICLSRNGQFLETFLLSEVHKYSNKRIKEKHRAILKAVQIIQ